MTMKTAIHMNTLPVMGSTYFYFTVARFFAGLFGVPQKQYCRVHR